MCPSLWDEELLPWTWNRTRPSIFIIYPASAFLWGIMSKALAAASSIQIVQFYPTVLSAIFAHEGKMKILTYIQCIKGRIWNILDLNTVTTRYGTKHHSNIFLEKGQLKRSFVFEKNNEQHNTTESTTLSSSIKTMASHDTNAPGKCPCCLNPWQAATAGFFCQICDETKEEEKSTAVRGLDRSNIDFTIEPKDNFYIYSNGNWMKNNPIPSGYSSWNTFQVSGVVWGMSYASGVGLCIVRVQSSSNNISEYENNPIIVNWIMMSGNDT